MTLTQKEKESLRKLVSETKGLSMVGDSSCRITVTLNYREIQQLIEWANSVGLSVSQAAKKIVQNKLQNNLQKISN